MVEPIKVEYDEVSVADGGAVRITGKNPNNDVNTSTKEGKDDAKDGNRFGATAEVTSNGFYTDGLDPYQKHSAGIACYLTPTWGNTRIEPAYTHDTTTSRVWQRRDCRL